LVTEQQQNIRTVQMVPSNDVRFATREQRVPMSEFRRRLTLLSLVCLVGILFALVRTPSAAAQESFLDLFKRVEELNKAGRKADAVKAARRLQAATEVNKDLPGLARANVFALIGQTYMNNGQPNEAVKWFKQSVDIKKAMAQGRPTDDLANSLHTLAYILRELDKRKDAVVPAREAVAMWERIGNTKGVSNGSNTLAIILQELGQPRDAEKPARRSLEIKLAEARGRDTGDVALALHTLSTILNALNRKTEAVEMARRASQVWERLGDEGSAANAANTLASMLMDLSRLDEAEFFAQKALAFYGRNPDRDNETLVNVRNTLVAVLLAQNKPVDALPIARAVVDSRKRVRGADNGETGNALNSLTDVLTRLGELDEAETTAREVVRIWDRTGGVRSSAAANARNTLASVLQVRGKLGDALKVAKEARDIWVASEPKEGGATAFGSWRVAAIEFSMDNYEEAEPLFKKALELWSRLNGDDYSLTSLARSGLMAARFARSNWPGVLDECATLIKAAVQRSGFGSATLGGALSSEYVNDIERTRTDIHRCIKSSYRVQAANSPVAQGAVTNSFESAQWAISSKAAGALAQMAARAARGQDPLADAIRERQRLIEVWQGLNARLYDAIKSGHAENDIRKEMAETQRRKDAIDAELQRTYPQYSSASTVRPVSLQRLQRASTAGEEPLLGNDEAVVLFLDTPELGPTPEETFVWVVTKTDVRWVRSELGTLALTREVSALRCGLDYDGAWSILHSRCPELLKAEFIPDNEGKKPLPFDLVRARELYLALFGQIEDLIKDKQLLIVPSGPLTQLPYQVLVTKQPKTAMPAFAAGYRDVAWLARKHAITVLPTVSSLKALRELAKESHATEAYIGFGNPLLDGDSKDLEPDGKLKKDRQDIKSAEQARAARCPPIASQRVASAQSEKKGRARRSGGLADRPDFRKWVPLPDTADELCKVAKDLHVDLATHVYLGERATESVIKQLSDSGDLAKYKVVHFATHGTVSDDMLGTKEPGLILTPPKEASEANDGYLSASEVGALKLDADWVILSACNTAAGGAPNAEALSGLARAFIYAGARSLLVSHWSVNSEATVKLITKAVAEVAPKIGRAEALRRSMLSMIDSGKEYEAHPAFWAPFVLVGEGGAAR
jgi:CHAT domain-containing protein/tetratricopeptide (TPR) repeat protein